MKRYPGVIDGFRGAYGGVVPDMPGACCAMGATVDEALADFVAMLEEDGEDVPPPSSIDDIVLEPGEMVAYVTLRESVTA